MSKFREKKIVILGLGISGRATARFLLKHGATAVIAVDKNPLFGDPEVERLIAQGLSLYSEDDDINLSNVDLMVISPGVPTTHLLCLKAIAAGIEVIGEIELACRSITQRCLGITGTNGKTTVTLLVAHVLNQVGLSAHAVGNVGKPLSDEIGKAQPQDILVIELSSYQLETLSAPVLDAAVVLNITPDHIDRYGTMDSYASAKARICNVLKPGGRCYVEEGAYEQYRQFFRQSSCLTFGIKNSSNMYFDSNSFYEDGVYKWALPKEWNHYAGHDLLNLVAAYTLCAEMGVTSEQFFAALSTFTKPLHRIEFVRTFNGAAYFDDSKGTNIDAVVCAVQSMKGPVILIAGGVDKGTPYTPWIEKFSGKVKCICVIGEAAQKIEAQLGHAFAVVHCSSLEKAVHYASSLARDGDNVLLSPGCSSYDMFKDYAHRGDVFKRVVNAL